MPRYELIIPPALAGRTVRQAAMGGLRLSGGQFKRAKFHGALMVDGSPVLADRRVHAGERLSVDVPEAAAPPPEPFSLPLRVPYEDAHFWMIDKPAPLPSSSSQKKEGPTLENALYAYAGCPEGFVYRPVNRLDKGTSGLMLAARTAHAQHLLQRLLHGSEFIREYLAVVEGAPPRDQGVIDLPIGKAEGATIRREVRADGKPARTHYRLLETRGGPQPPAPPIGHGTHPSDPGASLRAGLPRSGRFSLWNRAGRPARPLCPAQRAGAAAPPRNRRMDRAGKPAAPRAFGPDGPGLTDVYARVLS